MGEFTPVLFNTDAIPLAQDDPSFAHDLSEACRAGRNGKLSVRGFRKTFLDRLLAGLGLYRRHPAESNRYGATDCAQILRGKGPGETRVIICQDHTWWDISDYAWGSDDDLAVAGDRMPNKDLFREFIVTLENETSQMKMIYDKVYGGD